MKVTGFSFIRNAVKFDYPVVEAIQSVLPLCDEFIISVGNSDDDTMNLIKSINSPKIKIVESTWDDSLRSGGRVLAVETDKAYAAIAPDSDWCIYIQADEIIHEQYHDTIRNAMLQWKDHREVDGLLFNYKHFYGSYDYVGQSTSWYRKEIRIVRKNNSIYSYKDAQGFRKDDNKKLRVKQVDAWMYHYGWVKPPKAMQDKLKSFHKLWHDDRWVNQQVGSSEEFDYSGIDALAKFDGTHPAVMQARITRTNWTFDHDLSLNKFSAKDRFKLLVEKITGYRPGEYKNYKKT